MPELVGVLVGDYFLLECLAHEGVVETYRARPTTRGGYDVILRLFRPQFPDPTGFREHFAAEVEKVWRCRHEHIQPLLEFGSGDDLLFCVTMLGEAETLDQYLKRQTEPLLSVDAALRIVTQLCAALQYAHEQGIVHGNIQPSSILIGSDEQILLTNFGMRAAYHEGDPLVSQIHEGNAAYMAPEQSLGMIAPACDIYAVGVLLYRLLGGVQPYEGANTEEIALRQADETIPALRRLRPDLPEALEQVVQVALAKTPQARFATVAALAQAFQDALVEDRTSLFTDISAGIAQERRIPVRAKRTPASWQRVASLLTIFVLLFGLLGASFFILSLPQSLAPFRNAHAWSLGQQPTPIATATASQATSSSNQAQLTPVNDATAPVLATMLPTAGVSPTPAPPSVDCANGSLFIDGSPSLASLLQQAGANYQQVCPGMTINVQGDGSRTGLNLLQQGQIAAAASDLTARSSRSLTDHPLGALLSVLVVNPDVQVSGLSSAQIRAIYRGQITNWSQVGGTDEPITVIQRSASDPIAQIFRAFVLGGMREHVHGQHLNGNWAQAVAETSGAISYVPWQEAQGVAVSTLAIDGVTPDSASIIAGAYPFWSVEHLYTRGDGTVQLQSYAAFLKTGQESTLFLRFGVVPIAMLSQSVLASHLPGPEI
ncbi:MAG TPA: serine/threonine-protein kinase [Ktedonobacteraceae bacterium]|nr:serine/threonine-protein kinase [Ktedonobacteraceae bacterium]